MLVRVSAGGLIAMESHVGKPMHGSLNGNTLNTARRSTAAEVEPDRGDRRVGKI